MKKKILDTPIKSLRKKKQTIMGQIRILENEIRKFINAVKTDTDNENNEQKHSEKARSIE